MKNRKKFKKFKKPKIEKNKKQKIRIKENNKIIDKFFYNFKGYKNIKKINHKAIIHSYFCVNKYKTGTEAHPWQRLPASSKSASPFSVSQ